MISDEVFQVSAYGVLEDEAAVLAELSEDSPVRVGERFDRIIHIHRSFTEANGHHVSMTILCT